MTTIAINAPRSGGMTSEERLVIFASSLGTVFEWYDFYIYGTLGAFLAKYFFSNVPANVGFIFDTTHATSVAFSPGGNAVYNIRLAIGGGSRQAEFFKLVTVSCSDLIPKAGAISVTGSTP